MVKSLIASAGVFVSLGVMAQPASPAPDITPPGISVRLTDEGPVFVNRAGMTLYQMADRGVSRMFEDCSDRRELVTLLPTLEGSTGFAVPPPNRETRRSCAEKHPPLRAPEQARPVGKWTIYQRKDGIRQWAYGGAPLYTSIKDHFPGETNDSSLQYTGPMSPWKVASAPLAGTPSAIHLRRTAIGLVLVDHEGRTLYYPTASETTDALWEPLTAPTVANADHFPDCSIQQRRDGSKQWMYMGHPLYTYAKDLKATAGRNRVFGDIFGGTYGKGVPGWKVALLKPAPRHPAEVTVKTVVLMSDPGNFYSVVRKVYADAQGMTLYTLHCIENTGDHLDCDDDGDSPQYWSSFCGNEERCRQEWRPFVALHNSQSIDDTWSVIYINPHHPWKPPTTSDQLAVWAYKGRPVFTYGHDHRPGDTNGHLPEDGANTVGIYAESIPAYETN